MNEISFHVIRREEKILWESWKELISFALSQASASMRGMFLFRLQNIDLSKGHRSFNPQNFAQLLTNSAKSMKPGEERLIHYASLDGILKLKVETSWGKIDFEHGVQTFLGEPEKFDLFLKKLISSTQSHPEPKIIVFDLSSQPILEPENEEQQRRLAAWFAKIGPEKTASIFISARGRMIACSELAAQLNGGE